MSTLSFPTPRVSRRTLVRSGLAGAALLPLGSRAGVSAGSARPDGPALTRRQATASSPAGWRTWYLTSPGELRPPAPLHEHGPAQPLDRGIEGGDGAPRTQRDHGARDRERDAPLERGRREVHIRNDRPQVEVRGEERAEEHRLARHEEDDRPHARREARRLGVEACLVHRKPLTRPLAGRFPRVLFPPHAAVRCRQRYR